MVEKEEGFILYLKRLYQYKLKIKILKMISISNRSICMRLVSTPEIRGMHGGVINETE